MKIISTREFRNETKTYFELAEKERIVVKRGKKFVNFIVSDEPDAQFYSEQWVKDFLDIPAEYRCNPFDVSPSGDLYWADKRNVQQLEDRLKLSKEGSPVSIKSKEELKSFLDAI